MCSKEVVFTVDYINILNINHIYHNIILNKILSKCQNIWLYSYKAVSTMYTRNKNSELSLNNILIKIKYYLYKHNKNVGFLLHKNILDILYL